MKINKTTIKYLSGLLLIILLSLSIILVIKDKPKADVVSDIPSLKIYTYISPYDEYGNLVADITWETPLIENGDNELGYKVAKQGRQVAIYNPEELGFDNPSTGGFYTDTDITQGQQYTYSVSSFDRSGNESAPTEATITANPGEEETVTPPTFNQSKLAVSKTEINRNYSSGVTDTFQVWNDGSNSSMNFTVSQSAPWLGISPPSGTSTNSSDKKTITLTYIGSSLVQGENTTNITISAQGASPSTVTLPVKVTHNPAPPVTKVDVRYRVYHTLPGFGGSGTPIPSTAVVSATSSQTGRVGCEYTNVASGRFHNCLFRDQNVNTTNTFTFTATGYKTNTTTLRISPTMESYYQIALTPGSDLNTPATITFTQPKGNITLSMGKKSSVKGAIKATITDPDGIDSATGSVTFKLQGTKPDNLITGNMSKSGNSSGNEYYAKIIFKNTQKDTYTLTITAKDAKGVPTTSKPLTVIVK